MELRCRNGIKFGELLDGGFLEVKCRSARCGHQAGVMALHRFDVTTGQEVGEPRLYRDPYYTEGGGDGDHR